MSRMRLGALSLIISLPEIIATSLLNDFLIIITDASRPPYSADHYISSTVVKRKPYFFFLN